MIETNVHEDMTNGPEIWCFRNTLLKAKDFADIMRKETEDFMKQLHNYKDKFEFLKEFYVLVRVTAQEYSKDRNKTVEVTTEISSI